MLVIIAFIFTYTVNQVQPTVDVPEFQLYRYIVILRVLPNSVSTFNMRVLTLSFMHIIVFINTLYIYYLVYLTI